MRIKGWQKREENLLCLLERANRLILRYWHNCCIWGRCMNNKLRQLLNEYNWDDGFDLPKKILENPDCDLALALEIFFWRMAVGIWLIDQTIHH